MRTEKTTITFVSGNARKIELVVKHLSDGTGPGFLGKYVVVNRDVDLEEIQGPIEAVSKHKAAQAAEIIGGPVIVEDTSVCYKALNGLPGPYIKWFLVGLGPEGLVRLLDGFEDKSVTKISTFGFCEGPGKPVFLFQGSIDGIIVEPRGVPDFSLRNIIQPDGYNQTIAEMDPKFGASLHPRLKSLALLQDHLLRH